MLKQILLCGIMIASLTNCNFSIFSPTEKMNQSTFYDLGISQNDAAPKFKFESQGIQVGTVRGSFGTKIMLRTTDNKVVFDDANRWAKPPEQMLNTYLNNFFALNDMRNKNEGEHSSKWILDVDIYTFEYNIASRHAYLGASWRVLDPSTVLKGRYAIIAQGSSLLSSEKQPEDAINPGSAMNQCAYFLVRQVVKEVLAYEHKPKSNESK